MSLKCGEKEPEVHLEIQNDLPTGQCTVQRVYLFYSWEHIAMRQKWNINFTTFFYMVLLDTGGSDLVLDSPSC